MEARSLSPPLLQQPFNRMANTEGSNERDMATRLPRILLFNENEGQNTVEVQNTDDEVMAVEEEPYPSLRLRDGAAVFDAEVVEERDLQQEVQERMENMTIDAVLVINLSTTNEEENSKARPDLLLRLMSTAILRKLIVAVILLVVASGTIIIGTTTTATSKTRRPRPTSTSTMETASPTSISVLEFGRNMLTSLSGEDALMDESSSQYKALWWLVHDDPANMMRTMMDGNDETQSSLMLMMMILERYTMTVLYFSTDGPNWVLPYDFLSNQSICDWGEPILCSEEGAVVQIRMGTYV
jgi:hypothetical protein